jgi:hypothetical protein
MRLPRTSVHVGHDQHLVADVAILDHDYLARRHYPPRCPAECRPNASRAGAVSNELVSRSDGQADVGLDLTGNVGAGSAHGSQRLRGQGEPGRMPPAGKLAIGIFIVQSSSASASTRR